MSLRTYRYLQALLLVGLCAFLIGKIVTGQLGWYINLRFMPLTFLAVAVLGSITLAILWFARRALPEAQHDDDHHHEHEHSPRTRNLVILLLPLLVGVLIPAVPLNASAVSERGVNVAAPAAVSGAAQSAFEAAPDDRSILDWIRIFNYQSDLSTFLNQSANVTGFVYHDDRLADGQFMVSRFMVTCCAADAVAIGMAVQWPQSAALLADQWVEVKGKVQALDFAGGKLPLIQATSVEKLDPPDQPYLFP